MAESINRMEQLIGFVDFEKQQNAGKTHIAEWALAEIYRLNDAIEQARREEREACLKAADEAYATEHVLNAIRARGEA